MRTVYEAKPYEGRFRMKDIRKDFIQRIASDIIITVSGSSGKTGLGNLIVLKGLHNFDCIALGDSFDAGKLILNLTLSRFSHFIYFRLNVCDFQLNNLRYQRFEIMTAFFKIFESVKGGTRR